MIKKHMFDIPIEFNQLEKKLYSVDFKYKTLDTDIFLDYAKGLYKGIMRLKDIKDYRVEAGTSSEGFKLEVDVRKVL